MGKDMRESGKIIKNMGVGGYLRLIRKWF